MHLLQIRDHRDLHLDDLDRRDVELHQLMDLNCDMDLMQLVHLLHLDVVQNLDVLDRRHLQDVVHLDVLQNLDEQNLGAHLPYLDVVHLLVVVVDVELRHQLRMDYFQDVAQLVHQELELPELLAQMEHLELLCMQQLQLMPLALLHVMPSTLQDQRRAQPQVQLRVLGLPLAWLQQLSSLQLS